MITLGEAASRLMQASGLTSLVIHESVERGCEIIEEEARRVIGTYDYGWPQLKPATQAQRVRLGFPANEPLLRTGELRDSISHAVEGDVGYVFSTSRIAVYQELGTAHIPPRSFLRGAANAKAVEVAQALQMNAVQAFISALRNQPGRWWRGMADIPRNPPQAATISVPLHRP